MLEYFYILKKQIKKLKETKKEMVSIALIGILILITVALAAGCATAEYGHLRRSREVKKAFETNRVFSDYRYYYRGWSSRPYVIVGIQSGYALKPDSWKEFDIKATKLNELVKRMEIRYGYYAKGYLILNSKRQQIGVWYSSIDWAVVKMGKDKHTLMIFPKVTSIGEY